MAFLTSPSHPPSARLRAVSAVVPAGVALVLALGLTFASSLAAQSRDWRRAQAGASQVETPAPAVSAATDSTLEYRVKAAYLLNFTRYVEWPSEVYRSSAAPLVLCVYGTNLIGPLLERTVRGRKSQGRAIEVRDIATAADGEGCHVAFIGAADWRRRPDVLSEFADRGVLTVGEGTAFAEAGGVIAFVIEEQTVRFAVNLAAGERAGLRLSSRMLAIADRLYGESKTAGDP